MWETSTGRELRRTVLQVKAAERWALSADCNKVATAFGDRRKDETWKVQVWDASTGQLLHNLPSPTTIEGINFGPDNRMLAVVHDQDNRTLIWNVETGQLAKTYRGPGGYDGGSDRVYFGLDQRHLYCCRRGLLPAS